MSKITALDKGYVARTFARSRRTYEDHALAQKEMGLALLDALQQTCVAQRFSRVLEVGCCTGFLTEQLCQKTKVDTLFVNDLVPEFCDETIRRITPYVQQSESLAGDIEVTAIPDELDLILSSATLQWMSNLPQLFNRFREALKPGGVMAASILGPGTMQEIRELTGRGLAYLPEAQLQQLIQKNFTVLTTAKMQRVLFFDSIQDIFAHIRATGVGGVSRHRWTKSSLRQFSRDYQQQFGHPRGLPVTYVATTLIARTNP